MASPARRLGGLRRKADSAWTTLFASVALEPLPVARSMERRYRGEGPPLRHQTSTLEEIERPRRVDGAHRRCSASASHRVNSHGRTRCLGRARGRRNPPCGACQPGKASRLAGWDSAKGAKWPRLLRQDKLPRRIYPVPVAPSAHAPLTLLRARQRSVGW